MSADRFEFQDTLKDDLAEFFAEPSKDAFLDILDIQTEYDFIECKEIWIDKGPLAKHILAFANSGGGAIIIGVEEKGDILYPVGVTDFRDKAELGDKIEKFIPDGVRPHYELQNFGYSKEAYPDVAGKKFQVVFIDTILEKLPFVSTGSTTGIEGDTIYVRRDTKSEKANHKEIDELIQKRVSSTLESSSKELAEEIEELSSLYNQLQKHSPSFTGTGAILGNVWQSANPYYPDENLPNFIRKMIYKKKLRIERLIDVEDIEVRWADKDENE